MKALWIAAFAIPALLADALGASPARSSMSGEPTPVPSASGVAPAATDETPRPAAVPELLRTIVTVHAQSSYCKDVVDALDRGIELLSGANLSIDDVERTLRTARFDDGPSADAALTAVARENERLRQAAEQGRAVMARLRITAGARAKPEKTADLLRFEAALDAAFAGQRRLATQIGAIANALSQNRPVDPGASAIEQSRVTAKTSGGIADSNVPIRSNDLAKIAEDDVRRGNERIVRDEDAASGMLDGALVECR